VTLSPVARRRELKLATGELVHAVGGLEAAGSLVGLGKSQVHRCTSVNDRDNFLNAGDVAELERRSDRPFVTLALAKLAGGVFIRLPESFGDGEELARRVMELAAGLGEVSSGVADALADGIVQAREAAAIEPSLDEVIEKATEIRALLRVIQGKGEPEAVSYGTASTGAAHRGAHQTGPPRFYQFRRFLSFSRRMPRGGPQADNRPAPPFHRHPGLDPGSRFRRALSSGSDFVRPKEARSCPGKPFAIVSTATAPKESSSAAPSSRPTNAAPRNWPGES
jgi:hypothetical protein